MIGLVDRDRVDEELYDDHETAKAREVCMLMICLSFYVSFVNESMIWRIGQAKKTLIYLPFKEKRFKLFDLGSLSFNQYYDISSRFSMS